MGNNWLSIDILWSLQIYLPVVDLGSVAGEWVTEKKVTLLLMQGSYLSIG